MGHSGSRLNRSTWNAADYLRQTPGFVTGVEDGEIEFNYKGQNTRVIRRGISISDVRWLLTYLDRVTDAQIREGLLSSGASPDQCDLFGYALRTRIKELQTVAGKPELTHRTLAAARR